MVAALAGLGACGTNASSGASGTGGVPGASGTSAPISGTAGAKSGMASGSSGAGMAGMSGASSGGTSGSGSGSAAGSPSGSVSASGDAGGPDSGGPSFDASSASGAGAEAGSNTRDAAACTPGAPPSAQDGIVVDMPAPQGSPTYGASGFIYGIAQDGSEPPNPTLSDIKIQGLRVGGAQVGCPNGGYVNGQYAARWNVVKAYYAKAKAIGARLLLLVHDLWGADGACNVPHYPGDGGDWTLYTSFINQVIGDAQANGMTGPDVRWELWNEPDLSIFWKGTQAQWLEMWMRGFQQIRAALPNAVLEGPSVATGPGGSWASAFLDYVKTNAVVPDYVSWHEEGGGADPVADTTTMNAQLSKRGLTVSGLDANEYGTSAEQNPGHSAWYLARFERAGIEGLRGNWGEGPGLYEGMGALVTTAWQPDSQWWIYKRYADQTGLRSRVTAGMHTDAVAYQDASAAKAIVVVGNDGAVTGSVNVTFQNIPAWLQSEGTTKVLVETMPTGNAALTAPSVVSSAAAPVTCNAMTVKINWTTATDGYVVTLTPP
jgi:hypothetical protein